MAVLSDKEILQCIEEKTVSIYPFNKLNMSNSSYDVRLGDNYYESSDIGEFFCPWNSENLKEYWGSPKKAIKIESQEEAEKYGCLIGDSIILVQSGSTILGHTEEFIGGIKNITTMMKARSSLGRSAISICKCAGWGDIGYINRWTMEIQNSSKFVLVLVVGQRVGQIVFLRTGDCLKSYEKSGSYQKSSDLIDMTKNWTPSSMLPKLMRD